MVRVSVELLWAEQAASAALLRPLPRLERLVSAARRLESQVQLGLARQKALPRAAWVLLEEQVALELTNRREVLTPGQRRAYRPVH